MEPDDVGGPEANDNELLTKLRGMRGQFGSEPTLLKHLNTTVEALEDLEHPGDIAADDRNAD